MNQTVTLDKKNQPSAVDPTLVKLLSTLFSNLESTHLKHGIDNYLKKDLPTVLDKLAESLVYVANFKVLPEILKGYLMHYHLFDTVSDIVALRTDYYRRERGQPTKIMEVQGSEQQPVMC